MRKIILYLFGPFLLLALSSCQYYEKRIPKETLLSIEVINRKADSPRGVRIFFGNPPFAKRITDTLSAEGRYAARAELLIPQNHTVRYDDKFITFYAEPGDSVHLLIDAALFNARHDGITFSGDRAEFNNQLDRCYEYLARLDLPVPDVNAAELDVPGDSAVRMMERDIRIRKDSLQVYASRQKLSKEALRWMQNDITYVVANHYCSYKAEDPSPQGRSDRYALYGAPPFDPADPKHFASNLYAYYLDGYCTSLVNAKLPEAVLSGPALPRLQAAAELIASHEPATLCRDHMLYTQIWEARKEPGLDQLLPELKFLFTNAYIPDRLTREMQADREREAAARPKAIPVSLLYLRDGKPEALPREDFFEHLRKSYPGQVLFIDYYATWCGPCLQDFADTAPLLHKRYRGKEVVFVNLCMASEEALWQPAIRKHRIRGENYYVNQVDTEQLHRLYGTGRYPTRLLMDRRGEVVDILTGVLVPEDVYARIDTLLAQTIP